jgi:hypothetical protein
MGLFVGRQSRQTRGIVANCDLWVSETRYRRCGIICTKPTGQAEQLLENQNNKRLWL